MNAVNLENLLLLKISQFMVVAAPIKLLSLISWYVIYPNMVSVIPYNKYCYHNKLFHKYYVRSMFFIITVQILASEGCAQ